MNKPTFTIKPLSWEDFCEFDNPKWRSGFPSFIGSVRYRAKTPYGYIYLFHNRLPRGEAENRNQYYVAVRKEYTHGPIKSLELAKKIGWGYHLSKMLPALCTA
jgi:hypothetical protein